MGREHKGCGVINGAWAGIEGRQVYKGVGAKKRKAHPLGPGGKGKACPGSSHQSQNVCEGGRPPR